MKGRKVKSPLKMLGLAALAALMGMAVIGASSASAEPTTLCSNDNSTCTSVSHIHETSVGHALLLSSFATVQCEALFLGDAEPGAPLIIEGTFSYTCLSGCTATEENGPAEIKVLKEGTELAVVTGEGLVHVVCGLNCRYNGVGLEGHGVGALTAGNGKGEVSIEGATVNKESGFLCPSTSELDITTEPLSTTYIQAMKMVCLDVGANNGHFLSTNAAGTECTGTEHGTRIGRYELAWVLPDVGRSTHTCAYVGPNNGFYLEHDSTKCLVEHATRIGRYELGVTA